MDYYLFLDDERQVYDVNWAWLPNDKQWIVARNYGEFVDIIEQLGLPSFVAFDHDLADFHYKIGSREFEQAEYGDPDKQFDYGPEKTGYDAAKWLCNHCMQHSLKFPDYVVHSLNAVGARRIEDYIQFCKGKGGMK